MNIELQLGTPADAAAIREVTRAAYAKWVPLIGREPKPMTADYEAAVRNHRFDLLYADGILVALLETIRAPDHLLIENVAVLPQHQGKGLGRKLLVHAEQLAASLSYGEIRLYTNQRFAENVELYRHLGYRIDREEAGERGVTVYMSKTLQ